MPHYQSNQTLVEQQAFPGPILLVEFDKLRREFYNIIHLINLLSFYICVVDIAKRDTASL